MAFTLAFRLSHNPQVMGSSPVPAICKQSVSAVVILADRLVFEAGCRDGEPGSEDHVAGHRRRPAVGGESGLVERSVGSVEPGGPLVDEVRQRPLLEDRHRVDGLRHEPRPGGFAMALLQKRECELWA